MHPEWDENEIYGDVAILILRHSLRFDNYVSPICLPQKKDPILKADVYCMVSGFGRTQGTADYDKLNLQILPVVSNKKVRFKLTTENNPFSATAG